MIAITNRRTQIERYKEVRNRGAAWLLDRMNPDGSIGDPAEGFFFYRAPWTLSLVGATDAAAAICGWVRANMLTEANRIGGPVRTALDAYAYRDATLIVGAHQAMQYDLSHGLIRNLIDWQDPASGGLPNDLTPEGLPGDDMDIPYACGPGFAFIATGHLEQARAVYRFLERLYAAQRELPDRFYYTWSRSRHCIVTDYADDRRFWYVVENQRDERQRWTIGGIGASFLCRLYLAEPRSEYLDLARRYQAFSMAATDRQFNYAQVCKSSWGSSLLYQLTGEPEYEAWTRRMGDWYTETQHVDGYWTWPGYESLSSRIELTLEFVMHIDTVISGLAARP